MARSYGATSQNDIDRVGTFRPRSVSSVCKTTLIRKLPAVKNQGTWPVCSAVVSISMYEQSLLRDNLPVTSFSWAWTYLRALDHIREKDVVEEQLLTGVPLGITLRALLEFGTLSCKEFSKDDPEMLRQQLEDLNFSPKPTIPEGIYVKMLLPTPEDLFDALHHQHAIGFAFAVDADIDQWMHTRESQESTLFMLPSPQINSPRLATHAALITAIDMNSQRVTVENSFGADFGVMGFFFISFSLLFRSDFSKLQFYVLSHHP